MKTITETTSESDSVVLKKLAKGYGWEIKVYGDNESILLEKIKKIDEELRKLYGNKEEE